MALGAVHSAFQYSLTARDGSGFGSAKTVPAVLVPPSVPGITVPTVRVSGSCVALHIMFTKRMFRGNCFPVLPFLVICISLGIFEQGISLVILGVFSVFSRDSVGSAGPENPW